MGNRPHGLPAVARSLIQQVDHIAAVFGSKFPPAHRQDQHGFVDERTLMARLLPARKRTGLAARD